MRGHYTEYVSSVAVNEQGCEVTKGENTVKSWCTNVREIQVQTIDAQREVCM